MLSNNLINNFSFFMYSLTNRVITNSSLLDVSSFINLVNNTLNKIYDNIDNKQYNFIEDIELEDGVLKIDLKNQKTYVINIQKNNKQIWLSSPFSGPKRFEYINNNWIDIHNNKIKLYELLNHEFNSNYKLIGTKRLKLI